MIKPNRTCAFYVLYLNSEALFNFSFQFYTHIAVIFAEEVS